MVAVRYELFIEELTSLIESGEVPMSRIDDAVERILRVKFAAGLFEFPFSDRSLLDKVGCKVSEKLTLGVNLMTWLKIVTWFYHNILFLQPHRDLAREAVRKSLVLLKNGKDISEPFLPLNKNAKKIFVTGTHADDLGYQCGGWTKTWYGGSGRITIGKL